ncbi:hypothetical protein QFC21_002401 [Naganishia friedmannii]|uniref:Uncharacterized protein n=1 Tax=Naganishia friedmannii TaxID=89922 RepID=A0ACC2VY00_9TREE|nr:hypothetical protein QFC21_002401 [Naganishia friedmannii]
MTEEHSKPGIPIVVGILVGLAASFVQSLGLTIQRKSHLQNDSQPHARQVKAHRRPLWLFGFAIFIVSNVFGTIFQIGALPIVVLAPLGAVSLLWNAVLSRILLGEHFSPSTLAGTLLIALGASLIAIFGVVPEETHTLDELLQLFRRSGFVVYMTLMCVSVVTILVISHLVEFSIRRRQMYGPVSLQEEDEDSLRDSIGSRNPSPTSAIPFTQRHSRVDFGSPESPLRPAQKADRHVKIVLPSDAGSFDGEAERRPLIYKPKPNKSLTLVGMSFAACSGTLSGLSLLFAKCGVELLVITFASGGKQNQFKSIQSWILLAGLGITALAQLFYLNHSLRLAGPALICPLAFCFYNISSIFGAYLAVSRLSQFRANVRCMTDGLVFYSQFSELSRLQVSLVTVGILVLLVGVWSVSAVEPISGESGVHLGTWADDLSEDGKVVSEEDRLPFTDEPEILLPSDSAVDSAPGTPIPPDQGSLNGGTWPLGPRNRRSFAHPPYLQGEPLRRHSAHTRYGTLIPELAPPGLPTGFSIGFNTSSPGFALRSIHAHPSDDTEPHSIWIRRRVSSGDGKGRAAKRGLSLDMDALRGTHRGGADSPATRSGPPVLDRPATQNFQNIHPALDLEPVPPDQMPTERRKSWTARLFGNKEHP